MKMTAIVLALLLLAACGKKGAPAAPGPANEIIFPKSYPSR
jgi:predicted small lipoprotein YifL